MKFDKLIEAYEKQLEFDFTEKKKKTPSVVELSKNDEEPRVFNVFWDRNTYKTTASSKPQAIGNIAARISEGTNQLSTLRNKMDNCLVRDMKWNVKY